MATKSLKQTQREEETNYPEIKPMQLWAIRGRDRQILRSFLILAEDSYPMHGEGKRVWIYRDMGGTMRTGRQGQINTVPEFNLRHIAKIEEEVYSGKKDRQNRD